MSDGAPVCNLPNQGQVPALQAGRRLPSVPRATDLPSALAALRQLAQIVQALTQPAAPPFNNNVAPTNQTSPGGGGGTNTIVVGGGANHKGDDGKEAEKQQFDQIGKIVEVVLVYNPDEEEQKVFAKQVVRLTFQERETQKEFTYTAQKG